MFHCWNQIIDDGIRDAAQLIEDVIDFPMQMQIIRVFMNQYRFEILKSQDGSSMNVKGGCPTSMIDGLRIDSA